MLDGAAVEEAEDPVLIEALPEDERDFLFLLQYIEANNDKAALALLEAKPYLTCGAQSDGITPFIAAAKKNPKPCSDLLFNVLMKNGYTNVNAQNTNGFGAIHFLVLRGHNDLLESLLKHKKDIVDVNLAGGETEEDNDTLLTPAYLAAVTGNLDAIRSLHVAGADFTKATGVHQRTPLHGACWFAHADCVQYLIEEVMLDVNARDDKNRTPAHYLAKSKGTAADRQICAELLNSREADLTAKSDFGHGALQLDAIRRLEEEIAYLQSAIASHNNAPEETNQKEQNAVSVNFVPSLKSMCKKVIDNTPALEEVRIKLSEAKL